MSVDHGWEADISWIDEMDSAMREGMLDICIEQAEAATEAARKFVPNTKLSRGYSLGSLAASGYVKSIRGTSYYEHIKQARAIPGTRIVVRRQIESQLPLESLDYRNPNKAFAIMHFPLSYASLINDGFHHVRAKRFIIGVNFIQSSINKVDPLWIPRQRRLIQKIQKTAR